MRGEYQALVDAFPSLLRELDVTLDPAAHRDLGVLMGAIECIDRVLDATDSDAERAALTREIVYALVVPISRDCEPLAQRAARTREFLHALVAPSPGRAPAGQILHAIVASSSGDCVPDAMSSGELADQVRWLRELAESRGVLRELVVFAESALLNTEDMRHATDRETYFRQVEREGELTVELALLFARLDDSPADRHAAVFLREVAAPANLLDKLVDLRGDHARGEVAIDPGIATHLALAVRMVRRSWTASARYSSRMRFTIWGLGWLFAPARDALTRVLAPR